MLLPRYCELSYCITVYWYSVLLPMYCVLVYLLLPGTVASRVYCMLLYAGGWERGKRREENVGRGKAGGTEKGRHKN